MIKVYLNDVDITDKVVQETFEKTDRINDFADTCRFAMRRLKGVTPEIQDDVRVEYYSSPSWVVVFAGNITRITQEPINRLDLLYRIECEDYTNLLGAKLVNTRYEAMTAGAIVRSIINLYCSGFTDDAVEDGPTIATIAFDRVPVAEAIQKIAELTGYSWYVDYTRDVHFFATNSEAAPFGLTGTSNNFVWDSLTITQDISQVRNRVIVRGGLEVSATSRTETFTAPTATAERIVVRLANKFDSISEVAVNSVAQTVGLDYVNDDADFDCMWSFQEKYIRFTSGNTPASGATIEVTGIPLFPIIVSQQHGTSIAEFSNAFFDGVFEHFIKDPDIKSQDEALQRASAELDAYAASVNEGEFRTQTYGLRSGQIITINAQDTNASFLIQETRLTQIAPSVHEWRVVVASLRTMGIIEVLQRLLRKKTLTSGDGEILLTLIEMSDTWKMTTGTPTVGTTQGYYIWPTGTADGSPFATIVNLSTVGS